MRFVLYLTVLFGCAREAPAIDHLMLVDLANHDGPAATSVASDVPLVDDNAAKPAVSTGRERLAGGYLWKYSNGGTVFEDFATFTKRTGAASPATAPCCTTGHCGSFTRGPTLPAAGCRCGCRAAACNCHHSPNAGKPTQQQNAKAVSPRAVMSNCASGQCDAYYTRWGVFGGLLSRSP
jgi:hypothetical protein